MEARTEHMGDWSSTEQKLKLLEEGGLFEQIVQTLDDVSDGTSSPGMAYWRGKVALQQQGAADAVPLLVDAVHQQPSRAHAWYLLGACLFRNRQWLDAKAALHRALSLQPQLLAARMELGRVHLGAGEPDQALALMQAATMAWQSADQLGIWAQAQVQAAADAHTAAQAAASLWPSPQRLPEAVLRQWLDLAGGLHLAGHLRAARAWWHLLSDPSPSLAACSNPIPARPALVALLLLELLQPRATASEHERWLSHLRSLLWLPQFQMEVEAWQRWLRDLLLQSVGRLEGDADWQADEASARLLRAVLDALPALEPPGENNIDLYRRLDLLRQGLRSDAQRGARTALAPEQSLQYSMLRHQRDLERLSNTFDQLNQLKDAELLRCRSSIEAHLGELSAMALDRPNLLTSHPSTELLQTALAMRASAVEVLVHTGQRLSSCLQPCKAPVGQRRRWLLLASSDLPQCFLYRVEQKQQQLQALGCSCRVVLREEMNDWAWSEQLLWADAVVICRLPGLHPVLRAIEAARRAGLPVLYDIDDLIIDPTFCPPELATYGGTLTPEQHRRFVLDVPLFAAAMRCCDAAIVSTPTLARRWRQLNPGQPVQVLANLAPPALVEARCEPRTPARVVSVRMVVASGTKAHKQVWIQELAPALAELLKRHPQLQLDLLGHLQIPVVLLPHRQRIRCHPYSDYDIYLKRMAEADIGLVALEPGTFTDAKSAIRWMEFSYLGLASVLSPTRTYNDIIEDGVHARFARGQNQWVAVVEQLLNDPPARLAMAKRAQQRAHDLFAPERAASFWRSWIKGGSTGLFRSPSSALAPPAKRCKLLVLNVFFAPQSIGGATRVAQDQVKALVDQLGDQWEVTVLCTEQAPWQHVDPDRVEALDPNAEPCQIWERQQPLAVDVHAWHGARVVRLSVPLRPWREHDDVNVEAFCRRWMPDESFDLIHAHCLQVLSVAPLRVARELGIPYIVTLHDGWWLSPRQFLTRVNGRPVPVDDPLGHLDRPDQVEPSVVARDQQRRRDLADVLRGAAARLAVSQAFADLHHQAGIDDVTVLENRWQPMPSAQPRQQRAADQPLRCCFVGGMGLHKGMAVLQSAVMQAEPAEPGLQLTVIDSTLQVGDRYDLIWGHTAVQFLPSIPMAEMADFYADNDVLLAPSTWPESYGLVTREALSAGLWVVASDIGALAEPIQHGVNGHRVRPNDSEALAMVLEDLSAKHPHPQPLIAFCESRPPLHLELDQMYRRILCYP